jgi:hypothetical protein
MNHHLLSIRAGLCGLFVLLFSVTASAQFRAGVQGSVTDAQGGSVVGATVTLTFNDTGKTQQTTTSDEGFYRFSGLPPGSYTLTVEQPGFSKKTFENLAINAESIEGVNVTLETGGVAAEVTITDTLTPALQTENANLDKSITNQEVKQLPQFGRDPYELTRLTPGIFGSGARGGGGGAISLPNQSGPGGSNRSIFQTENQPQISANGQRISANNYQIDGTSVNSLTHGGAAVVTPNQESVKEVRVIANTYSAEYGRNSGAQVLTVSQNGTNEFHGSAFLKNNSPGLNAFNKFNGLDPNLKPNPRARNEQHYNQFGGSIGGPIFFPRFGEGPPPAFGLARNKAFFFFSYEGLRQNTTNTFTGYVETPEFRQAVLASRPGSVTAGILGAEGIAPRLINMIPVGCGPFLPNCQQLPGGLDIGRLTGSAGQYVSFSNLAGGAPDGIPDILFGQFAAPLSSTGNQYNLRLDFNPTDKDTLAFSSYLSKFRGVQADQDAGGGARPMADITTEPTNEFATITYTRVISPTMLNEARVNATRFAFNEVESSKGTNFGLPRIEIENLPTPDRIKFGANRSETTPGIFAENTFEVRDTLRISAGNHALSFGGEYRLEQDNNNLIGGARPKFTFAGLFNFANSTPLFYEIMVDPRTGGPAVAQRYFRNKNWAFFGQDDWKFRPNLTFNLGLRWEYFGPLTEKEGRISNLVLGEGDQALTNARLVVSDQLYPADKNNFAPRVGFAWSPNRVLSIETADKLVIRGGFGIAYNRIPVVLFANARGNPPFSGRVGICCGTSAQDFSTPFANNTILYALGANNTPFSYPANPALRLTFDPVTGVPNTAGSQIGLEVWGAPAEVPTPYVYTYSLQGQYSLPANLTATLGYQGSAGRKLMRLVNQRIVLPGPGNFWASGVFFPTPDTNSSYNALLATLNRRFARGFQFDVNYRWAKSIDIVSNEAPTSATNPTYPYDVREERGPSDYDVRHNLVISGLWDLPIFRNRKDALGAILGGWQLSGIATFHTGFPWTPVIGQCVTSPNRQSICPTRPTAYFGGAGTNTSNDAFINGTNFPGGGAQFFDVSAPGTGELPGVGRNSFRGPNYRNIDLTLGKRFGLGGLLNEGAAFEVKANVFNVFNILNLQPFGFNTSSTIVTDARFGRATAGLSGRVIEIQGRFSF